MDSINFLSWFVKLFLQAVAHLTTSGPVILIYDGHYSHVSMELIQKACESNVYLLCLPLNMTHLLQPLDVGVFSPMKTSWRKILRMYRLRRRGGKVTKETFPSLVSELWQSLKPEYAKGGFRAIGISIVKRTCAYKAKHSTIS